MFQDWPSRTKAPVQKTPKETKIQQLKLQQKEFKAMQPTEARLQLGSVPDQDPVLGVEQLEALSLLIYLEMIWHQFQEMPLAKLKE
jgi:hypothetical protein